MSVISSEGGEPSKEEMYSNRKTIGTAATGEAIGKGEP
jgi:hypothetical protein